MKTIKLTPYKPEWAELFKKEALRIQETLKENCQAIHHIGSTAIPDLAAKDRLDIIIESLSPADTIQPLEAAGFEYMGEFNIPFHYGFRRRTGVEINLHVYQPQHPEIILNLTFRDYLRANKDERNAYKQCKQDILANIQANNKGRWNLTNYSTSKGPFIRNILKKANFQTPRFTLCSDEDEWSYIKQHGDTTYPSHDANNTYCMLYHGGEIVGYTHLHNKNIQYTYIEKHAQHNKDFYISLITSWLAKKS